MAKPEKEKEKDAYYFSLEKRTCPGKKRGETRWFKEITSRQLEGIEHEVRPQMLFDLSPTLKTEWLRRVWHPYVKTLPPEDQRVIMKTLPESLDRDWWYRYKDEAD